jgi:hypothetical protein
MEKEKASCLVEGVSTRLVRDGDVMGVYTAHNVSAAKQRVGIGNVKGGIHVPRMNARLGSSIPEWRRARKNTTRINKYIRSHLGMFLSSCLSCTTLYIISPHLSERL